uniref:RRM domain-containing protein n=1 Tax=Anabas testudineus TaxID=64144 RepID=A0A7N6B691_ANATE
MLDIVWFMTNMFPTTTAEQLLEFFKQVGDVKFVRMAGDETQPTRFAFVEFVEQESVARALTFNGVMFGDRPLKYVFFVYRSFHSKIQWLVNHSNNAIVKPPELTPQAAAKELENVMKRVREAQSTIAAAIEPGTAFDLSRRSRSKSSSCSHSRTRRKSSHSKHKCVFLSLYSHSFRSSHKRHSHSRDMRHSRSRSRYVVNKQHAKHQKIYSSSKDRSRSPRRKAKSPSPKR